MRFTLPSKLLAMVGSAALGFEQRPAPANAATDASFWRYELASRAPINHHIQVQA